MSKKWIAMAAVLLSVATVQGAVLFLEEFDGNNKAYAVINNVNSDGKWADFGDRITARDIGDSVEGYTTAVGGTETVLAGTVSIADIQIRSDFIVGITNATSVNNISWRVRVDKNNDGVFGEEIGQLDVELLYGTNRYYSAAENSTPGSAVNIILRTTAGVTTTVTQDGNGWAIIKHSFATNTIAAIKSLRLDAYNSTGTGQAFEVDWVKIEALPEQGVVLFLEEFDGNNKAYAVTADGSSDGKWADFGNRITARDIGDSVEGYTTAVGGTETVLAGTANNNDIQIRSDFNVNITNATSANNISWRVRVDKNDDGVFGEEIGQLDVELLYGTNRYFAAAANSTPGSAINLILRTTAGVTTTVTQDGNGWAIVNYSFATNTIAAIKSLRLDAVNISTGSTNRAFEVDWVKIEAIRAPEPRLTLFFFN
jgi:hypothetical protein